MKNETNKLRQLFWKLIAGSNGYKYSNKELQLEMLYPNNTYYIHRKQIIFKLYNIKIRQLIQKQAILTNYKFDLYFYN